MKQLLTQSDQRFTSLAETQILAVISRVPKSESKTQFLRKFLMKF